MGTRGAVESRMTEDQKADADAAKQAFCRGFAAGARKEHALAADCVQKRLAKMPEAERADMLDALFALGLDDLADPDSGPVSWDEDAVEAYEQALAAAGTAVTAPAP